MLDSAEQFASWGNGLLTARLGGRSCSAQSTDRAIQFAHGCCRSHLSFLWRHERHAFLWELGAIVVVPAISCSGPRIRHDSEPQLSERLIIGLWRGRIISLNLAWVRSGPVRSVDTGHLGSVLEILLLNSVFITMLRVLRSSIFQKLLQPLFHFNPKAKISCYQVTS